MMSNNENGNEFTLHLKLPAKRIFAYQHSHPGDQIMGVAIDAITGKILEAVILPTKQRVMLGLGIGNTDAQAHVTYRRFGGKQGYDLIWIEDPEAHKLTEALKDRLVSKAQAQIAKAQDQADITSELTEQLVRQGVAEEKEEEPTPVVKETREAVEGAGGFW